MRKGPSKRVAAALRLAAREDGFAVPFVTLALIGAFTVASVGVIASVRSQQGTSRDQGSKEALAAAEAGVSEAILHYNRLEASESSPCLVHTEGTVFAEAAQGDGWCRAVPGAIQEGGFSYRVLPAVDGKLEVVSTGTARGTSRRVHVEAQSSSGRGIFSEATVKALNSLVLDSNAVIEAGVASNGDILLRSNARICGDVTHGVGRTLTLTGNSVHECGEAGEGPLSLPPVNQGDAPDDNDNDRFFTLDPISGNASDVSWNAEERELSLSANSSLTIGTPGGSVYSLCRLQLTSNTTLFVAPGASAIIYFDDPANCSLEPGEHQLDLSSNAKVTASTGGAANLAMLFVGSPTIPTSILLNSNTQVTADCEANFVIYAPRTDIELDSNARYCAAMAGQTLHMDSNATVFEDSGSEEFVLPNLAPHYEVSRFVECTANATGGPESGC